MTITDAEPDELMLLLSSGQTLKVHGIELYPADELAKIAALRAEAAQKLGGVSSGLGFIGSPGWVIGASAVLGLLEASLSDGSKKSALRLLAQAEELSGAARSLGHLCQIESIKGVERPNPGSWTARATVSKRVMDKGFFGKETYRDVSVSTVFVHSGDDFLGVETDGGLMNIRWSSVVGYVGPNRTKRLPLPE
jgi:hypothetical protein